VRQQALGLEVGAEVLAHVLGAGGHLDRSGSGHVDGTGQDGVAGRPAGGGSGHGRRFSPIRAPARAASSE
jgi:hypothetical protein